ncbi:GTP-dependent dephospho-CoA kinase family protein [Halorubellus salinus]|uniref:GTP-dependent dephospho-CoA kinase family protein n=1 Tax=Halorubellus salinus TaxID=755309 RepID=UPI001D073078
MGDDDAAVTAGDVLVTLPESLRSAFKEPFGPVETDADALLADVDGPLIAVGDIVTYHFLQAGREPDVAVVDEHTKRELVDDAVRDAVVDPDVTVSNPAGALSNALVRALGDAVAADEPTTVFVDGEEDLAVLPAVMVAPVGASVVYGQPDAGMVHVPVTEENKAEFRALIDRMDGDLDAFWAAVDDA